MLEPPVCRTKVGRTYATAPRMERLCYKCCTLNFCTLRERENGHVIVVSFSSCATRYRTTTETILYSPVGAVKHQRGTYALNFELLRQYIHSVFPGIVAGCCLQGCKICLHESSGLTWVTADMASIKLGFLLGLITSNTRIRAAL